MILVLGGGFGLYGHLPALIGLGKQVVTLSRYRDALVNRNELRELCERVDWCEDEDDGMSRATTIVLARTPRENRLWAAHFLHSGWKGHLVIEKPLGETVDDANEIFAAVGQRDVPLSVPYLFRYTDWYASLASAFRSSPPTRAEVDWQFQQSPSVREWKRTRGVGGGAFDFYFIHCLALAEQLLPGASCVLRRSVVQTAECFELDAIAGGNKLRVVFELGRPPSFRVTIGKRRVVETPSPFGGVPAAGSNDVRVTALQQFYQQTVFGTSVQSLEFHRRINELRSRLGNAL